jgi:4-hydroxybenzoate polyprenyltransferase
MRAWLQLFRPPNLFTAMADILGGWCLIRGALTFHAELVSALVASALFYTAGVVLNDVFDVERDRAERPERPIPSGRVNLKAAFLLGIALLIGGATLATAVGRPCGLVGALLVVSILLYDAVLKTTWIAPGAMGLCRALNWGLGMTAAGLDPLAGSIPLQALLILLAACTFVTGVTWFARAEAGTPQQKHLVPALLLCVAGAALFPVTIVLFSTHRLYYALVLLLLIPASIPRGLQAARDPSPQRVQSAVKLMIFGLVILDATVAAAFAGHVAGLLTIALLVPAVLIARKLYVT